MNENSRSFSISARYILLVLLLWVAGLTEVAAQDFIYQGLKYRVTGENTVTLLGHENGNDATGLLWLTSSVYYAGHYYSVTKIGASAFAGCTGLSSGQALSIPNSVTSIGNYAFSGCTGFGGNLTISNSTTYIGAGAFYGCTGFNLTLTIPESVTEINVSAFNGTNFSTVKWNAVNCYDIVPNSTYYGPFANMSKLKTIHIGSNVQSLPAYVFYGCSHLTTVYSQAENPPVVGNYAFNGVNTSLQVNVPCGSGNAYQTASGWSVFNIVESNECEYLITGLADPVYAGSVSGSGTFNNGTTCTLTANPNPGYYFVVWTENGTQVSTDAEYTFTATNDRLLVAHFQQQTYTIDVSHFPSAGGSTTGGGTFMYGNSCTVTATPNPGFLFVNWTEDGNEVSTNESYTFNVTDSRSLQANFVLENIGSEQIVFADANVKAVCVANWDTNGDGELSYDEAAAVTNIGTKFEKNTDITSFDELQYFTGLTSLYGGFTHKIVMNLLVTIPYGAFYGCTNLTTVTIPNSVTLLKPCVFMSCSSLPTIDIPQSVTSIEDKVFYGCTGLTSMTINSNTPPVLGSSVFNDVDMSIPVNVPCAAINAYMIASGWNEFTNYQGIDCVYHQIYVTANPAEGGTVMGEGSYLQGTSCTLTAVAYTGYAFANWTENGTVVSTNASYTFNVTGERTIVANFNQINFDDIINFADANVKAICVANWDTNGDGELSYDEAAAVTTLGSVFSKNTTITTFNELQYFTGLTQIGGGYGFVYVGNNTMQEQPFGAFVGCTNLTSIVLPNTITLLSCTFNGCESLTSIEIPSEVTQIGRGTFRHCYSLTSIEIPNAVSLIDREAFYECTGLTTLDIGSSVTTIGNSVFYGCSNLASMTVRALTPPSLGTNVFNNVVKTIPVSVFNVALETYQATSGWSEFNNYSGMECIYHQIYASVNPEESGMVTGVGAFIEGTGCVLTAINNPGYSFVNWTENGTVISTNVTYTVNVTGERVLVANFIQTNPNEIISFADDNVRAICVSHWDTNGDSELSYDEAAAVTDLNLAFKKKTSVISFDEFQYFIGLTALGPNASKGSSTPHIPIYPPVISTIYGEFYNCQNLTSIVLPNNLTSIGNIAFKECHNLISIEIPSQVTLIDKQAFYNCSGLTSITVRAEAPPTLNTDVFYGVNKSIPVYVPAGKVSTYQSASGWNEFTNFQEIPLPSYDITATANPFDGGTITGIGTYNHGTTCTLTATANECYTFVNWTENGNEVSTEAEYTFTVTGDRVLVANFGFNGYDITAIANPAEGGTVTGDGTYINGTSCTLIATANEGYTFVNWTENGNEVSTDAEYTFTVTGDRALVANFNLNSHEISATANPTEGGEIAGTGDYDEGSICTLTATANEGYVFINWTENGNHVSTDVEYTFTVTGGRNLVANFSLDIYSVAATANPNEGGTVTGTDVFYHGSSCTLTATANEGYVFVNWTENGNQVSTDAEYTFTVTGNRDLVANFQIAGNIINHWTPCDEGLYSGSTTVMAVVKINGIEQHSPQMELAAFCGNECRGTAWTSEFPVTHRYLALVNVYGENGDELTFKAYNHATNQELEMDPEVTITFSDDGSGTLFEPLELNFVSSAVTQTINLVSGTNWVSFNVEITLDDLKAALVAASPNAAITIKSQTQKATYNPSNGRWTGRLTAFDLSQMYKITVGAACEITFEGVRINPAEHPVTITPGANWIAYPLNTSKTPQEVFTGFAVAGDMVKSQSQKKQYNSNGRWTGQLGDLEPGKGYIYTSSATEDRTFVFPTRAK